MLLIPTTTEREAYYHHQLAEKWTHKLISMRLNPRKLFMLLRSFVCILCLAGTSILFPHISHGKRFMSRMRRYWTSPVRTLQMFSTRLSPLVHVSCKWWLLQPLTHVSPSSRSYSCTYGLSLTRLQTIPFFAPLDSIYSVYECKGLVGNKQREQE